MPPQAEELCRINYKALFFDAVVAVAALVHLKDKFTWGLWSSLVWGEIMGSFAVQISAAVSNQYWKISDYREALAPHQ